MNEDQIALTKNIDQDTIKHLDPSSRHFDPSKKANIKDKAEDTHLTL